MQSTYVKLYFWILKYFNCPGRKIRKFATKSTKNQLSNKYSLLFNLYHAKLYNVVAVFIYR